MSIWTDLAAIGVGAGTTALTGGNVAAGVAAAQGTATVIGGGGSSVPTGTCPGQPTDAVAELFRRGSPTDIARLRAAAPDPRIIAWIDARDAAAVANAIAGGDDCEVTTAAGRTFSGTFAAIMQGLGAAPAGGAATWSQPNDPGAVVWGPGGPVLFPAAGSSASATAPAMSPVVLLVLFGLGLAGVILGTRK